jgi:hypothetical protein
MNTTVSTAASAAAAAGSMTSALDARILAEGYGSGAWHGPDLKAALADVSAALAFWRPAPGRHNIAEIALHHAYAVHTLRARLTGRPVEPFVLAGEDWFALPAEKVLGWAEVLALVDTEQRRLTSLVGDLGSGRVQPAPAFADPAEVTAVVLGITCHAIYHAGQIQLIKVLSVSGAPGRIDP